MRSRPKSELLVGRVGAVEHARVEHRLQRREALAVDDAPQRVDVAAHRLVRARRRVEEVRLDVGHEHHVLADVAAEQQDDRGLLGLRQAGARVARPAPSSSQATWFGVTGGPADRDVRDPRVCAACASREPCAQRSRPSRQPAAGVASGIAPSAASTISCSSSSLAVDVAVQRHRGGAELLGDAVHRHRLEALLVGDRRSPRPTIALEAQPRPRALRRAARATPHAAAMLAGRQVG